MFTRLTEHCRPAERLARMVLGASSLLDAAGATGAAVFLIDMNKAFEDFVAARLTRYLAGQLIVHTSGQSGSTPASTSRSGPTSSSSADRE